MYILRPAVEADWAAVRAARLEALRSAPDAYGSTYERESAFDEAVWRERCSVTPDRCCFLALAETGGTDDAGGIAGTATGLADAEIPPEQRLLVAMWIFPEHRGRGLVDRLTEAVADWARSTGATTLRLDVTETNVAARRAYLRLGFRPTGEQQPLPGRPHLLEDVLIRPLD